MDEQIKIKFLKYFDHGLQKPFYKNKEERFSKPFWIIGYQITFSPHLKKKEDKKMDVQIKIKILKSFDHGLQKPFSKKQRREIFPKHLVH